MEYFLQKYEMTGTAYRQKLRKSLRRAKNDCFNDSHALPYQLLVRHDKAVRQAHRLKRFEIAS
jgi:hypothetical protein